MDTRRVDVIATTVSGSIQDWGKVKRIAPLFSEHGMENVRLHVADSHREAREKARAVLEEGGRTLISAGGSGTFNSVLEGCCDSGLSLGEIVLGFLRKGSADLIGKVLGMPDDIESAVRVFVDSIREERTVPCDVILARSTGDGDPPRHLVGYGGAEIFGRIPHYTENRLMKYYKGVLGQIFGDLGPFTTGMTLAVLEKLLKGVWSGKRTWSIRVDGALASENSFQALILVNGYLGPELPYSSEPLGSGKFYLFALRDLGVRELLVQAQRARDGSIMKDPERWGLESYTAADSLVLEPDSRDLFPVNADGATMSCHGGVEFRIVDRIRLISRE
ncbi:MAG: diacylglycerol/lipid kinase family protein [Planctomycetota bacterium]